MMVSAVAPGFIAGLALGLLISQSFSFLLLFFFILLLLLFLICVTYLLLLASSIYGAFMLMGGLVVSADNLPSYWKWFSYTVLHKVTESFPHFPSIISFSPLLLLIKYAFEGLVSNEFSGAFFYCDDEVVDDTTGKITCECLSPDYNGDCIITGDEVMRAWGFDDIPKWEWVAVLIAIAIFYHFGFYLCLRFFNTGER